MLKISKLDEIDLNYKIYVLVQYVHTSIVMTNKQMTTLVSNGYHDKQRHFTRAAQLF